MRHIILLSILTALLAAPAVLRAQPPVASAPADSSMPAPRESAREHPAYPELFYLHGALGLGIIGLSSSDLEQTVSSEFELPIDISSLSVDYAYGVRAGYRNILQFEYRIEQGFGQKLNFDQAGERIEVEANLDSKEWLIKANPVFFLLPDPSIAVFLVYGQGEPEYNGDLGILFEKGDKTIFGAEFTKLFRWYAVSFSAEYHDLSFESYRDEDTPPTAGKWVGSQWMVQVSVSAGFGE